MHTIHKTPLAFLLLIVLCSACARKREYQPPDVAFLLNAEQLPAYENDIDHKGLINASVKQYDESLKRGATIYNRTCVNCHGTPLQEGSIPTAFKYWKDPFKVGKDPYTIYQTLTRGYGSMPPQVELTPVEKYDVIHYIREALVSKQNKGEYFEIDSDYLNSLPHGKSKGPDPVERKPWAAMDYGNFLINTYELVGADSKPREISSGTAPLPDENLVDANFAYKGIAVRVDQGPGGVAAGNAWMIFDHDLMRLAGAWTGKGFIDWEAILFNGTHNISPRTIGDLHVANPVSPGWANPVNGSFTDVRFQAKDKRRFGPLPRSWAHYKGLYQYEDKVIVSYSVGDASVLELLGLEGSAEEPVFTRTLNISPSAYPLSMRVAQLTASVAGVGDGVTLKKKDGFWLLEVPKSKSVTLKLLMAKEGVELESFSKTSAPPEDLQRYTHGGTSRYPQKLMAAITTGKEEGSFQVDRLELPWQSPWKNQFRLSGIDFLADKNKAVICSTDGDVWLVEGLSNLSGTLTWKRIASGLFQPLGIKVVDEELFVTCRDQLVKLHDLNSDGEMDFYESFNNDHQVTNHFHEFAMGLQTDNEGNFYYAKSARHARRALVPQHGTLLKVSKDGLTTEIIARGFRAANGVCLNPDGSFIVTDQEGHWNPMNRINWVTKGGFYGNMFGYNPPPDSSDTGMEQPLTWVERDLDQSPSELLWVDSKNWGPLNGSLLNFSYGYGKVFIVPHEKVGTHMQGGIFELPIPVFSTGVMRGRFNAGDGHLYVCGLSAWGSTQPELGGLYRIRYQGDQSTIPVGLHAKTSGMQITFTQALDEKAAGNVANYEVKTWDLKRSRSYGSKHYNEKTLAVTKAELAADKKSVMLTIPDIQPTWVMEISYKVNSVNGAPVKGLIQNTIHHLQE